MESSPPQSAPSSLVAYRHDAPDPDRDYEVITPVWWLLLVLIFICAVASFRWNPWAILSPLSFFLGAIALAPQVLDNHVLRWIDQWGWERAKTRRMRKQIRRQRHDRWLARLETVPGVLLGTGLLTAVAALVDRAFGGGARSLGIAAALSVASSFAFAFILLLLEGAIALDRGDEAKGPLRYYKTPIAIEWLSGRGGRTLGFVLIAIGLLSGTLIAV